MPKLSEIPKDQKFIFADKLFVVVEHQKNDIVLVRRCDDNHLFPLPKNTDIEYEKSV